MGRGAMPSQFKPQGGGAERLLVLRRRLCGGGGGGGHRLMQLPPDPIRLLLLQGPRGALRFEQPPRLPPTPSQTTPSSGNGPELQYHGVVGEGGYGSREAGGLRTSS